MNTSRWMCMFGDLCDVILARLHWQDSLSPGRPMRMCPCLAWLETTAHFEEHLCWEQPDLRKQLIKPFTGCPAVRVVCINTEHSHCLQTICSGWGRLTERMYSSQGCVVHNTSFHTWMNKYRTLLPWRPHSPLYDCPVLLHNRGFRSNTMAGVIL